MGKSSKANENYIHTCNISLIDISNKKQSLSQAGYSDSEFQSIIDFYLFHAPILKSTSKGNFGQKSLSEYKWSGFPDQSKLERALLKSAKMNSFCIIRADSIQNTLEQMSLGEKICTQHPRAVLMQNFKVSVLENGEVNVTTTET